MARKRINKKLVVGLTFFVFLTVIILSVLMLRQLQQGDPQRFVALAERYEAKEEWRQAALFYHKAWENGGDHTHLVRAGEMLTQEGEVGQALYYWRQALVSDPNLVEAHTKRIELLLELATLYGGVGRSQEVHEAAEAMLDAATELAASELAFAYNANGLALVKLASQDEANVEKGLAELRMAVELAPDNVDYAIELGMWHVRQKRVDEGEGILRELPELFKSPGEAGAKARSAYAKYLSGRPPSDDAERNLERAEQLFEESLVFAEDDPTALLEAKLDFATFLSQQWARAIGEDAKKSQAEALFGRAEAMLKQCIEADAAAFDAYLRLASLYLADRRHTGVVEICEQRLGQGLARKGVQATRNKASAFRLMIVASQACVAQAVEASAAGEADRKEEWIAKAQGYLDDAGGEYPNHPDVLSQSGQAKLALGQERAALDDLRRADTAYRAIGIINWENKLVLAQLHLKLNEPGAAKNVLEEVWAQAEGRRRAPFYLVYAEALLRMNDVDRASTVIDRVLLHEPDNSDARRLKAAIYAKQGRSQQASSLVDSPTLRALLEAQELSTAGDVEGAVNVRRKALKHDPADVRLVTATVGDLLRLDRAKEAREIIERATAAEPDNNLFKRLRLLAQEELSDQQRDEALLEIIEGQADAFQRAWDLVDFHMRRKGPAEALEYINQAEQHLIDRDTPMSQDATTAHHRILLEMKVRLASELDDEKALDEACDSAAEYNVEGAGGKTILALYHIHRDEIELAISALREVIDIQPTDARALTLLGQSLQKVDRTDEARRYFEQAVRVNPIEATAHRGLAALAKARGDTEIYEEEFAVCEALIPEDPWVKAEILLRQEDSDPAGAIARREALLKEDPDDYPNLFRLAKLCEAIDDLPKADGYWEELLSMAADEEDDAKERSIVVVAAKYYRRTGRPEKSLELVTRFAQSRQSDQDKANAQILLAAHYLSQGDLDLAKTTLLAAADIAPTFEIVYSIGEFFLRTANRPGEAVEWFDRAVELARSQSLPQLKNVLITRVTCLLHRSVDDVDTAQKRVEEFIADYPDDPQGHLFAGEVHARRGEIAEAITALSTYIEKRPDHVYALAKRASHYASQGRLAPAIEDLETVKRLGPSMASQIGARILLSRLRHHSGQRDAWLRELESLVEDAPDSARAVSELVDAYLTESRFDDADRTVTAQINRLSDQPEAHWFFLRGRVSLEAGDYDRALTDLRRGAQLSDFAADGLARVLDAYWQANRPTEGIEYYRQHAGADRWFPAVTSHYARLLAAVNRPVEAVEAFRRAMRLATADSFAAVQGVTADLRSAAWPAEEAIALFETPVSGKAIARANDRILVRLYRMADRTDDAIEKLDRLIQTAPDDRSRADLLSEQAELHESLGRYERARRSYEEALKYDNDSAVVLNNLAYVLSEGLGNNALALPYAERAVAIADTPATLDTLGWIYTGLGQYTSAVAELSRAIRLDPGLTVVYYHLGEAHRRNGGFLDARPVLDKGLAMARQAEDTALTALFEAALEKTARRDTAP
ncbi:MAG: tetratricopeptide repeat protein [Planctomycetota bacterium]|jgi:tetratricopeptide (TPR) repeat protein